ncbi:MAG TPA: aminomethyl-transferring glycine dehydrogenase subunit GcvPA [Syntrophomonadaceae bacterium]|nr:aminomethyl-transferring glycine dehydrogenase subunit GcvPA [Syntrophomonadaceae bacterium]
MNYVPNPPWVVRQMLDTIGAKNIEDLFADIPEALKLKRDLNLPRPQSEVELRRELAALAGRNLSADDRPCFLGAGAYDHYIPAVVEQLLLRSEFYTAYTPYQPELSQGVLQTIFEYQTMICNLTGMDLANASMYDGGSALAEACSLACDATRRRKILIPDTVHPRYLEVIRTYAMGGKMEIITVPGKDGSADPDAITSMIDNRTAAVVIQHPNFYGNLETALRQIEKAVHGVKGLLIMAVDPISLGLLKPPGAWGADIAVGEGQSLGNPLSFGGPYLGFFAASEQLMRRVPGRLVGETVDREGNRAFVLTLQAREQHIRREKAGSNICSNEALCALAATIYLTLVGREGLKEIARRCHQLACYAKQQLEKAGLKLKYQKPFFKEFAVAIPDPRAANTALLKEGIIGGYELDRALLLAFTEKRTRAEIDRLASILGGIARE